MMRDAFLAVRGDTFEVGSVRTEIEEIAHDFGEYLSHFGAGGGGASKHRALGAVGKALQHARVARGDALFGYARRVHEQTTQSTFAGGPVVKLDEGLRKLDALLSREGVPPRAAGEILERIDYATYYDVRRRGVAFHDDWKRYVREHGAEHGLEVGDLSDIPWFSKKKLVERGPAWAKACDAFLAARSGVVPAVAIEADEEG